MEDNADVVKVRNKAWDNSASNFKANRATIDTLRKQEKSKVNALELEETRLSEKLEEWLEKEKQWEQSKAQLMAEKSAPGPRLEQSKSTSRIVFPQGDGPLGGKSVDDMVIIAGGAYSRSAGDRVLRTAPPVPTKKEWLRAPIFAGGEIPAKKQNVRCKKGKDLWGIKKAPAVPAGKTNLRERAMASCMN